MTKSELTTFGNNLPHIAEPIANSGDKVAIPTGTNNSTDTNSSIKYGHPHRMSVPLGADGGVPVPREDMNGIYYLLSQITHYLMAGGKIPWSQAEATAIGGYPQDAEVMYNGVVYKSTANGNTTTPGASGAKWSVVNYLPTSGGTMTGKIIFNIGQVIAKQNNTGNLEILGGTSENDGAYLKIHGGAETGGLAGVFSIVAKSDTTGLLILQGKPSGELIWNNKNIVRSVKNVSADTNGNVDLTADNIGALPLGGGTMTGTIISSAAVVLKRNVDSGILQIQGANVDVNGAMLQLGGKDYTGTSVPAGGFELQCVKHTDDKTRILQGKKDGNLTWDGKNIVRSVNGVDADAGGNVEAYKVVPSYPSNPDANKLYFVIS